MVLNGFAIKKGNHRYINDGFNARSARFKSSSVDVTSAETVTLVLLTSAISKSFFTRAFWWVRARAPYVCPEAEDII
jgi:hypothetical protein